MIIKSKIEKVPRGILINWSTSEVPKRETEPGVRKGKRSLLASHTRCKCSMETTHNSAKVKLGIKVMKLVESLLVGKSLLVKGQNVMQHS